MAKSKVNRKPKAGKIFLIILFLLLAFWLFENFTYGVKKTTIQSSKVSDELTFVQLSDLHGQIYGINNGILINKVNSLDPDLIFVTGDMYSSTDESGKGKQRAIDLMASFEAPVYFVAGEHDANKQYLQDLRDVGVHVLSYDDDIVEIGDTKIKIYGINNAYFGPNFILERNLGELSDEYYNILLAHIPNFEPYMEWGADLTVCGDTHGGIIQVPFAGPLYYEGEWLPELLENKEVYDKGLFEQDGHYMYVSCGLGNFPFPARLFNRPELTVLKVVPEE